MQDKRKRFIPPDNSAFRYRDGSALEASKAYSPHVSTRFLHWDEDNSVMHRSELPELYTKRSECCGCSVCAAACNQKAIFMLPDEEGFLYPVVDVTGCIRCGRCEKVCSFKNDLRSSKLMSTE